jgi:glycosyltransferase involved in cell wall biosynthesis
MVMTSKIALIIDALPAIGGAEKVLMSVVDIFPDAPVYTLLYNRAAFTRTSLSHHQVITSIIEHLPFALTQYRKYLPLMPFVMHKFDLSAYDIILSFSYAVAHGVKVLPGQQHFAYTFTPMRYAWRNYQLNGKQHRSLTNERIFQLFRLWDTRAAASVDRNAAVSGWIAECVRRIYHRDATVIYPPVEVERFSPANERGDYFVALSRLVPHKRVDLIVEAFNRIQLPLVIVGEGPERSRLERQAKDNIHFVGYQSEASVSSLLNRARAFICACEEDFGIAMVEAQAAGCPVIAYGKGGALEIVLPGQTGIFFDEQSAESLAQAVLKFTCLNLSAFDCAVNAERFNKGRFISEFSSFVNP